MLFVASTTILPSSTAPYSPTVPATAPPGMASTTTSASFTASPMGASGAPPGPSPVPWREPYTTSYPAARHLAPSVPPMWPVPITAILMPALPAERLPAAPARPPLTVLPARGGLTLHVSGG